MGQINIDVDQVNQQQVEPPAAAENQAVIPPQGYLLTEIGSDQYTVPQAVNLIVETIIAVNAGAETPLVVLPSPNYLMANPWVIDAVPWVIDAVPWVIDAVPWVIDAVPWVIDAVPWVIDAVPWVIDAVPYTDQTIGSDVYISPFLPQELNKGPWQQWGLIGPDSIELYTTPGPVRTVDQTGNQVDIFIFDTSPFAASGVEDLMGRELFVYHPTLPLEIKSTEGKIQEHGYFASGLIRMVSPNSRFHLVRVLNDRGQGDLFSFVAVLEATGQARGGWEDAVINLSMSMRILDEIRGPQREELRLTPEQAAALKAALPEAYHPLLEDELPLPALFTALRLAQQGGAVVIAAAGNSSDITQGSDLMTGIPARWPFTVAVAGSNVEGARACFSNRPRPNEPLFAPAGDGEEQPVSCNYPFTGKPERPKWTCPSASSGYDCRYALSSLSSRTGPEGNPRMHHWIGTSFAAPLASGTAALMRAEARDLSCDLTSVEIGEMLVASVRPEGDLLNVPAALAAVQEACSS